MAAKKVILYFENHRDALRFTLAAGSVMSETDQTSGKDATYLIQPLARATRIRVGHTASQDEEPQQAVKAG